MESMCCPALAIDVGMTHVARPHNSRPTLLLLDLARRGPVSDRPWATTTRFRLAAIARGRGQERAREVQVHRDPRVGDEQRGASTEASGLHEFDRVLLGQAS